MQKLKTPSKRVKIRIDLNPEDEQRYEVESLWGESLGQGHFRILNSPFFVFGLSSDDVVKAKKDGSTYRFEEIVRRGGHSTYRIFLQNGHTIHDRAFQTQWQPIAARGVTFENANDRAVAIDIPPNIDVSDVYRLLKVGE